MTRTWMLYIGHVLALAFGLGGILIAVPNPHLWAGSEQGARVFEFGMTYGGATHIIFGALAMLSFGAATIGWRRTLIFFGFAVPISLSSELIGTTTGWPFGNYAYTSGLGAKVLDRVPFTIPLSWFYLGFASYILGLALARRYFPRHRSIAAVGIGVYLLVVWDLVLDPAMAHEDLPVKFWEWSQTGPYFGMPLINFAGWALTGLIFFGLARLAWRSDPTPEETPTTLPFMVYLANTIFAMALSLSVDLWQPVVIAFVLGIVPAAVAWIGASDRSAPAAGDGRFSQRVIGAGAGLLLRRFGRLSVEGNENLPEHGPAILVSRHYHHLYDGCALQQSAGRHIHILVALDWVKQRWLRVLMEKACGSARWPVVLRLDGLENANGSSAYQPDEANRYLRRAVRDSLDILRDGGLLVVFPEAYPTVDPGYTPKSAPDEFLPFRPGFARIAALAGRRLGKPVPLIPVGLEYSAGESESVTVRFGPPVLIDENCSIEEAAARVERRVIALSGTPAPSSSVAERRVAVS